MNTRTGSWLVIFFLICSIFGSFSYSIDTDNNVVKADSVVWENEYGRLEVEPATSYNLIRQRQWYNMTWYYPDNTIDIAFGFDNSLSYGKVFYWNGASYVPVGVDHVEYNNRHFYVIDNINVVQDETKHGYWEYDTPPMSDGKWDMYAKLSSDSWSTAFSSGRIIHLDPWWNSSWQRRKDIYIDRNQVPASLVDFPVYVFLNSSDDMVDDVQNDGGDIVFVNSANDTILEHEIESFSTALTINARIWVKIPFVKGSEYSENTHINMYYKNPSCDNQWNPSGVWDANYLGVYHMNQTSGVCWDSTSNGNHGTYNGNLPNRVSGMVAYGQSFDGTGDYITLPNGVKTYLDGTWEYFVNCDNTVTSEAVMDDYKDSNNFIRMSIRRDLNPDRTDYRFKRSTDIWNSGNESQITAGSWFGQAQHWADNDEACLWINGDNRVIDSSVNTDTITGSTVYIGVLDGGSYDLNGDLDEIRISNIKRNDSWMAASYNTIANESTFVSFGSEFTVGDIVYPITDFVATTQSLTNISLSWTRSSTGNYTYVEYNTAESWARGDGTLIYNGTGSGHDEFNLTARTQYYFRAWAFNESLHNFSDVTSVSNDTGPLNPTSIVDTIDGSTLNFTWVKGVRSDNTIIMRKLNSYPSYVGDGTEIYNGSATGFDDTGFTTDSFYTFFAHSVGKNLSSVAQQVQWGALRIQVYDENTSDSIFNYTVLVSNQTGTETFEMYSDGSQSINIDIGDLPTGEDVIIKINATVYVNDSITHEYEDRVYYMDISPNTFYNLTAYLPKIVDSYLYRLTVVGPKDEYNADPPIEDANVDIKHYINSSFGWESVGIYLTDGDGNIYVHLIPGELYKVTCSATDYLTDISDYIPSDSVFEQSFRLNPVTASDSELVYDDFWEHITIDIDMISAGRFVNDTYQFGNITIEFADSNSSIIDTQIRLYEMHGANVSLLYTWDNTSVSFNVVASSINTTRMHYISLHFNTSASYFDIEPVIIMIPNVDRPFLLDPFDLDDRIDDIIGPFVIGDEEVPWSVIIGLIIPLIILVSLGPLHTGMGIIGSGLGMIFSQIFLNSVVVGGFNWGIAGIGVFIVVIGILYMMTKGQGDDYL